MAVSATEDPNTTRDASGQHCPDEQRERSAEQSLELLGKLRFSRRNITAVSLVKSMAAGYTTILRVTNAAKSQR